MTTTTQTQELQNLYDLLLTMDIDNYWIAYYASKNYDNFWVELEAAILEKYKDSPLKKIDANAFALAHNYTTEFIVKGLEKAGLYESIRKNFGVVLKTFYRSDSKLEFGFNRVNVSTDLNGANLNYSNTWGYSIGTIDLHIKELQVTNQMFETKFFETFIAESGVMETIIDFMSFIDKIKKINYSRIKENKRNLIWEQLISKGSFGLGHEKNGSGTVYLKVNSISKGKANCAYLKRENKGRYFEEKWIYYNAKDLDGLYKLVKFLIAV